MCGRVLPIAAPPVTQTQDFTSRPPPPQPKPPQVAMGADPPSNLCSTCPISPAGQGHPNQDHPAHISCNLFTVFQFRVVVFCPSTRSIRYSFAFAKPSGQCR